jgi:hypothetical protein
MKMFESDDIPFSSCAADDDPLEETESKSGSENKSLSIDLGQIDSTDANDKKVPNSPHGSSYRPVTPNTDILGSLWDDINRELEKCKANKTEGGNTSPKSHHNTDRPAVHTLSNYRRLTRPMSQDYDIIIGIIYHLCALGIFLIFQLQDRHHRKFKDQSLHPCLKVTLMKLTVLRLKIFRLFTLIQWFHLATMKAFSSEFTNQYLSNRIKFVKQPEHSRFVAKMKIIEVVERR